MQRSSAGTSSCSGAAAAAAAAALGAAGAALCSRSAKAERSVARRRQPHDLLHLVIAYRGAAFCGWQRQTAAAEAARPSVQAAVDAALAAAFGRGYCGSSTRLDAGVHARELRVEARVPPGSAAPLGEEALLRLLNAALPVGIAALGAAACSEPPRASAAPRPPQPQQQHGAGKEYRYLVWVPAGGGAGAEGEGLETVALRCDVMPSLGLMRAEAAQCLGRHDFAALAKAPGSSSVRTVRTAEVLVWPAPPPGAAVGDPRQCAHAADALTGGAEPLADAAEIERCRAAAGLLIGMCFAADGFLRHQVRLMAQVVLAVGTARRPPGAMAAALRGLKERGGLPAHGLWLWRHPPGAAGDDG
eukprot:TRINITY_DN32060_c0_g1_i1.p1 TRINITY_DN32060_c0_g1~~TRINITY_DN32060_c0_g1_i1.p1  ORF type:complete len:359 (+),score=109.52 TRINITY_DN32060_c0_g1_i1:130-1206(+)